MKSWTLLSGALFVFLVSGAAHAQSGTDPDDAAAALSADAAQPSSVSWDDFDDPDFNPSEAAAPDTVASGADSDDSLVYEAVELSDLPAAPASAAESAAAPQSQVTSRGHTVVLGPHGVDDKGVIGRVHLVAKGDTLWDVSEAYFGTPWVWPSVWNANQEIVDPHQISPGDRLWITAKEMRAVSDEEAVQMVAVAAQTDDLEDPAAAYEDFEVAREIDDDMMDAIDSDPAAAEDVEVTEDVEVVADDSLPDGTLDQLPVGLPYNEADHRLTGRSVRVSSRAQMSFISDEEVRAATSAIGTPSERMRLSTMDVLYLGLGEGEVEIGDTFTLYRNITQVNHPATGDLLGYHTEILAMAEVTEIDAESCVAVIRAAASEVLVGDKAVRTSLPETLIDVRFADEGIEGMVAYLPNSRTLMATSDYLFIDIGAQEGLEVGTDLEVYESGSERYDSVKNLKLLTPDRLIADLVVVTVAEDSAVAFVAHSRRGLTVGDKVRGATRHFPSAH